MSNETERLERDVESHRSTVESTIEELRSRLSVGQIVDELSTYVKKGQGADLAKNLGRQVRDNPLALGLVGAGIAWLLMGQGVRGQVQRLGGGDDDAWSNAGDPRYAGGASRGFSSYSDEGSSIAGDGDDFGRTRRASFEAGGSDRTDDGSSSGEGGGIADGISDLAGRVGDGLSAAASSVSGAAGSVSSALGSAAGSAADAAKGLGHRARAYRHDVTDAAWQAGSSAQRRTQALGQGASQFGSRAGRTVLDTFTEEPLILGAVVVAIGAAIGASLPSSRAEDQLLGEARDSLRDEAYERGKDILSKASNVASETYRAANEEVDRQGLKPTGEGATIAEKLSGVVRTAAETAKTEAQKEGLV